MATPTNNPIPTEDKLRMLIANGLADTAQELISYHKLPYRIENDQLVDSLKGSELHLKKFITVDPVCLSIKQDVIKLARCPDEVLITGETGTGKELIAQAMIGDRDGKFVAVNCAGFPESLIESELFGYMKGSFTGAEGNRQGLMAVAKGGCLFLDEVGELPMSMQAKLLRALQDKTIRRVGGKDEEPIDCKFVCATNKDVKKMVQQGTFREDLYARISTFTIHIPPLRDRECDIVPVIQSMTGGKMFLAELEKQDIPLHKLETPFNIRSLQQYVKRWNVLGRVIL